MAQVADQLRVIRQQTQDLHVRKRDVQKEADRALKAQLAQIATQGNQLVVVNPDGIARLENLASAGGRTAR